MKLPTLDERSFGGLPLSVLEVPDPLPGDYVDTLAEWGNLPEVLALPDAAAFVAHRCGQNPQAIRKVLEDAILQREIRFWGLAANGSWKPFYMRVLHRYQELAHRDSNDGSGMILSAAIERNGRLHSEAMGVNAIDVVDLLKRRGRKIPPELESLLPPGKTVAAAKPVPRSLAHEETILTAIRGLGYDPMALPTTPKGKAGVKAEVRAAVKRMSNMNSKVFDLAWQRLRDDKRIAEVDH